MLDEKKVILTLTDAAEILGVKKNYMYQLVYKKAIPFYKPTRGRLFFKRDELEAFIFRHRQAPVYEEGAS